MIRDILLWPDPRLSRVCPRVVGDVRSLADDLLDTMYHAEGRGLAAPQIGQMTRVFVMDGGWKEGPRTPRVCINPKILQTSDQIEPGDEGCLSIPGVTASVPRSTRVLLAWSTVAGERIVAWFRGAEAIIIQHELDHLDGLVTFDRVDAAQRSDLEAAYGR